MIIGIPKEIKKQEYRVGLTPEGVSTLTSFSHEVWVEENAGKASGFSDEDYRLSGALIKQTQKEIYEADLIVKVKEPQKEEVPFFHPGQIIFGYFHLAADPSLTHLLLEKKIVAIAYETITDPKGKLPLLTPMSQLAGKIAVDAAANFLQITEKGKGKYLGRTPGTTPANVVVLGGGVVGYESAKFSFARGAEVSIFDTSYERLNELNELFSEKVRVLYPYQNLLKNSVQAADVLIGAILIPGRSAPKIVSKEMITKMSPGSVVIDVSVDQGGCIETTKPTTHADPIFFVNDVIHYGVTNMPSLYPKTATEALTIATFPFVLSLANLGFKKACLENIHLQRGVNLCFGKVPHPAIAEELKIQYTPFDAIV